MKILITSFDILMISIMKEFMNSAMITTIQRFDNSEISIIFNILYIKEFKILYINKSNIRNIEELNIMFIIILISIDNLDNNLVIYSENLVIFKHFDSKMKFEYLGKYDKSDEANL